MKGQEVGKLDQDRAPSATALSKSTPRHVIPAKAGIHCVSNQQWASLSRGATAAGFSTCTPISSFVIVMPGKSEEDMQNSGNEARKLLKTKEVTFCSVRERTRYGPDFARPVRILSPASASLVIPPLYPTASLAELGALEGGPPGMGNPKIRTKNTKSRERS